MARMTPARLLPYCMLFLLWSCDNQDKTVIRLPQDCTQLAALEKALQEIENSDIDEIDERIIESFETAVSQVQDCQIDSTINEQIADAFRKIGLYYYYVKDQYDSARVAYDQGLARGPSIVMRARIQCNYGLSYHGQGDYEAAVEHFKLVEKTSDSTHTKDTIYLLALVKAITFLGDSYLKLGDYQNADSMLAHADMIADRLNEPRRSSLLAESYLFRSNCKRLRKDYPAAISIGEKGVKLLESLSTISNDDFKTLIGCYSNISAAWQDSMYISKSESVARRNAGDSAISYSHKAIEMYDKIGDKAGWCTTYGNHTELHRRQANYDSALQVATRAITVARTYHDSIDPSIWAHLYINRGEAYLDSGNLKNAATDFDWALSYLVPGFTAGKRAAILPSFDQPVISPLYLLMLLNNIARLRLRTADTPIAGLQDAAQVYDSLLNVAIRTREGYFTEDSKINLWQEARPYIDSAFSVNIKLYEHTDDKQYLGRAFQIAELVKSLALLEAVRRYHNQKKWPAKLREAHKQLLAENNKINREAHLARQDTDKKEKLNRRWRIYTADWRQHVSRLPQAEASHYRVTIRSASDLQNGVIDNNQALIEYIIVDSVLHAFLLQNGRLNLRKVKVDTQFFQDINTMDLILKGEYEGVAYSARQKEQFYSRLTYQLYKTLFPDFGTALPERLIVIPDESFLNLPFEALWTRSAPGGLLQDNDHKGYLLYRHAISYAYSTNQLGEMSRATRGSKKLKLAAFAPSPHKNLRQGNQSTLPPAPQASLHFDSLPNRQEIEEIQEKIPTKTFIEAQATRDAFIAACKKYAAVHVATHGVLNNPIPKLNYITFSQPPPPSKEDSLLYLQDLFTEELDLELAVFSACETARGTRVEGEGNMSMARGLATAGVQSIVTTLWSVNPYNTKELMPLFYEDLMATGGLTKDVALAQAKRRFISATANHRDPATWAGAILIGNTAPLTLATDNSLFGITWYLLLLLAVPVFWWLRRRSRA